MTNKVIPITILTGFLGSGKTTLLNQLIEQNPTIKFGLIINEFGEVGIDGQLLENSGEELVEMSNGCLCCVVRTDLIDTVKKVASSGKVDYIVIEASGLAEPKPIADTFVMDNLEGLVNLDGIIALVDSQNYHITSQNYKVATEQIQFADIIVLNKIEDSGSKKLSELKDLISKLNPVAAILENSKDGSINSKLLIETGKWSIENLTKKGLNLEEHDHHDHYQEVHENNFPSHAEHEHHHHHEHDDVDEVVFKTEKIFDPNKLDTWLQTEFPKPAIRAKGIMQIHTPQGDNFFVFQMVGASKTLVPFETKRKDVDLSFSRLVFIGKGLDNKKITADLEKTLI